MRILLAVHAFPPRATAGVEVYTLRLAKALGGLGHEVLVLTAVHDLAETPGALRRREHEGVAVAEVVNLHHRGTLEATYADPDVDRAAAEVLEGFRPDVVHLQHLLNLSVGVVAEARRRGAPVLMTLHDYWLSCPRDGLRMRADLAVCSLVDHAICARCLADSPYLVPALQRGVAGVARVAGLGGYLHRLHDAAPRAAEAAMGLARRLVPLSDDLHRALDERRRVIRSVAASLDHVLAPTRFVRDRALELGLSPDSISLLPIGAVERTQPRRAGPRPRLAFVGTLAPHKGVHVLIEAFRGLADAALTLEIHGSPMVEPTYAETLRQAAAGDPRIRFHGPFAEGGQAGVLRAADALVVPSVWWENSPLVVLEALAAGLPVIASATGGVPELLEDGETGLLVPPGDVAALREAIAAVASGRRLGSGRDPVALKTVEDGARELLAAYAEARRRKRGRGDGTMEP